MATPDFDATLASVEDAIDALRKSDAYTELGPDLFEVADHALNGVKETLEALRRAAQGKS